MRILYFLEFLLSYVLYFSGVYFLRKKLALRKGLCVSLVYHRIKEGRGKIGDPVSSESFDWQMRYLSEHAEPVAWKEVIQSPPEKGKLKVLVTFDDGFRDAFSCALLAAERYGIPAVVFACSGLLFGRAVIEEEGEAQRPGPEELERALGCELITIGNHTSSHRILYGLSPGEIEKDIMEAQDAFKNRMGVEPEIFAYPRGRRKDFSDAAVSVLKECGFKAAFTMMPGVIKESRDPFVLPRIGVSHVNDKIVFKVKLIGLLGFVVRLRNRLAG